MQIPVVFRNYGRRVCRGQHFETAPAGTSLRSDIPEKHCAPNFCLAVAKPSFASQDRAPDCPLVYSTTTAAEVQNFLSSLSLPPFELTHSFAVSDRQQTARLPSHWNTTLLYLIALAHSTPLPLPPDETYVGASTPSHCSLLPICHALLDTPLGCR